MKKTMNTIHSLRKPKWIIQNGSIKMGKVVSHKDLASDTGIISGGGYFHYNDKNNTFIFYGKSVKYGQAIESDFIKASFNPIKGLRKNVKLKFSLNESLEKLV